MIEKHDVKQVFDQHLSSLRFQADSRRSVFERTLREENPVMKKKMSVALVLMIVLILAAVAALATITVLHSDSANRVALAREALYEKYGLTPETLGMFPYTRSEENGAETLVWTCNTYHPSLTGIYTTVVKDSRATASWSHDDVDKALYDSGDLSAPIWGYKQLEAALADPEAAAKYSLALYQKGSETEETDATDIPPASLQKGERYWEGEVLRPAEPAANSLTQQKAHEIAVQALAEDYGLDRNVLATATVQDESFLVRENGGTLWDISLTVTLEDVEHECVVRLDGSTGEVLSEDVLTGGNG